ncbi:ABC transporter permease [Marinibaculum pumilum]|uniref:ABC transporter permease n=1 Tax=Marinibaculum pumilum TaxID=1766165 RepID=A0ABV7LAI1_9PROT
MIETLLLNWLAFTPVFATPLMLAAVGLIINERAGVLNLGAEGMMMVGALTGVILSFHTAQPWLGILCAALAGGALAAVFAAAVVVFRANQVVAGLITVALGAGLAGLIGPPYSQKPIAAFERLDLGPLTELPWLGRILFNQDPLLYLSLLLVAATGWVLFRTRLGLRLRACGESPETADAAGVDVQAMRLAAVVAGGMFCGLAGGYLSLAASQVWVEGMTGGRGWIAIALVIFAAWRPWRAVLGALLFGGIVALIPRIQATGVSVPTFLLMMLPYLATLLVLLLVALRGRTAAQAPDALGRDYAREDRQ